MCRHAALSLLLAVTVAGAAPRQARLRWLQATGDAERVSFYLDGRPAGEGLAFGTLSDYQLVEAGLRRVAAFAADGSLIDDRETRLEAGFDYTVAVVGSPAGLLRIRDRTVLDPRRAFVRAVNLIAGSAPLTVAPLGDPPLGTVEFAQAMRPAALTAGDYRFTLREGDAPEPRLTTEPLTCAAGETLTLFLLPDPDAAALLVIDRQRPPGGEDYRPAEPATAELHAGPPRLRVLNVSPDTPPFDLRLGEAAIARGLGYGQATDYVTAQAGTHSVAASAGDEGLITQSLELLAGQSYTLLVFNPRLQLGLWLLGEVPATFDGPAQVRVVNTVPELATAYVDLEAQADWSQTVEYLAAGEYQPLPESAGPLRFRVRRPGEDTVLRLVEARPENGRRYSLILSGRLQPAEGEPGLTLRLLREERP